jgi:hypothetical protein
MRPSEPLGPHQHDQEIHKERHGNEAAQDEFEAHARTLQILKFMRCISEVEVRKRYMRNLAMQH